MQAGSERCQAAEMRPRRIRYLLVFFAAMFLVNNAVASARACMVTLAAEEHTAIRVLDTGSGENLCPEADDAAANCLAHCTQSYKSDQQNFSFDVPAVVSAPPLSLYRAWIPIEPRRLVIASAQPVVGPPLTILFGNLRI